RRRHTRWPRDWSSDVCSSDLFLNPADPQRRAQDYAGCENDRSNSDFPRRTDFAAYVNGWNHRHARTQHTLQVLLIIEHDLDRHALDYFHIIAGRVFRRQQSESRATASL